MRPNGAAFDYLYHVKNQTESPLMTLAVNAATNAHTMSQINNYYAFGNAAPYVEGNLVSGTKYNYLYGEKEIQDETGLYDHHARMYDPAIGKWNIPGPLSEYFSNKSPYNYSSNNPINFSEPTGLEYSDNILIELNKLNLYIDRVQKLSNNSRERIDLTKESIEIEEFFRQLIQHNYSTKEKQVTIELKIRNCYPYLYVDFLHFSNVIDNIIENSIKYSKDHVNISIVVYENQKGINISISDNGFGISDKDIPNIFNKYYRSKNSIVQKKVGFGLGLTYVKTLVEAHQGMVIVNSVLGKGTEFCIIFPIKDESKEGTDY
ncbi:ATP-binding protein [Sphingobacterium sp. Lzh-3]|uniref:ATP-binding protein n=1 Tax=Sphingobacterium sp. Lzh-3 TaxID=3382150 RepID=UPI00398C8FA9